MRMFKLLLPFVVLAGIGALSIGGPASGQVPVASIVASDFAFNTAAGAPADITVAAGDKVTFSYPAGSSFHNVAFKDAQPTCTQTAPATAGAVPPLPSNPAGPGWTGECTFTSPATYAFYCVLHPGMTGAVKVPGSSTGPPSPSPAPPGPVPPPPPVSPPPAPATGPAASLLRVTTPQRSFTLRGSVVVRSAGSRLLARAFARRGALSGGRSALQVQVGRQQRSSVGAARVTFAVPLSAAARRALRRNGRLAITLRLTVTPPSGRAYTAARLVILRAP